MRRAAGRRGDLRGQARRRGAGRGQGSPAADLALSGWQAFWGGNHRLYVNDRHRAAYYAKLAQDLTALLADRPGAIVLDFGCGDALAAPALAAAGYDLLLHDPVPAVQARIAARFAGAERIRVLDSAAWQRQPTASIDAILVVSVLQYLSPTALDDLLAKFHDVLRPDGVLYLADVIPPDAGMLADVTALLRAGAAHGFLLAAVVGLAATFFSDYRRLKREIGLTTWSEGAIRDKLQRNRFASERLRTNTGFSRHRMLIRASPTR